MTYQNLWDAAKVVLRGKFIAYSSTQETRKTSNKQSNLKSKETRKRRMNKA